MLGDGVRSSVGAVIDLAPLRRARRRRAGVVDEEVIAAAAGGDADAWATIYRWLVGPVRGYVVGRGSREPDDLVCEVFVHVARGLARFDGSVAQFRSWVFVVAHHRVIDERRRAVRERCDATAPAELEGGGVGDVEVEALEALGEDGIARMLAPLTDIQRDVLLLRFVADLSLEDVAAVLERPVGSVKQLQLRAVRALRRHGVGGTVDDLTDAADAT